MKCEKWDPISFTTSVITTMGGRVKVASKIDVFMCSPNNQDRCFHVFSYTTAQRSHQQDDITGLLVPFGISFTTSVITATGGRVKFISNMDVFISLS